MGRAARDRGYAYLAICDHTPAVGAVQGLSADDVRRQAEEIAAANATLAPFRILRGIECDILPDGRLDLPDDVLAELDWVQASVHGGQRMPARQMTDRVLEALRNPYVRCLSHPTGRYINRRPENALDLDRVFEVALEHDVAIEINGLPIRLDLSAEHARDAIRAGITLVCSTDAHSPASLDNMQYAVATARRAGATPADVLNTRPEISSLARCSTSSPRRLVLAVDDVGDRRLGEHAAGGGGGFGEDALGLGAEAASRSSTTSRTVTSPGSRAKA